jgi:hypothetical protein
MSVFSHFVGNGSLKGIGFLILLLFEECNDSEILFEFSQLLFWQVDEALTSETNENCVQDDLDQVGQSQSLL